MTTGSRKRSTKHTLTWKYSFVCFNKLPMCSTKEPPEWPQVGICDNNTHAPQKRGHASPESTVVLRKQ